MMKSRLFHTDRYVAAQDRFKAFLNAQEGVPVGHYRTQHAGRG